MKNGSALLFLKDCSWQRAGFYMQNWRLPVWQHQKQCSSQMYPRLIQMMGFAYPCLRVPPCLFSHLHLFSALWQPAVSLTMLFSRLRSIIDHEGQNNFMRYIYIYIFQWIWMHRAFYLEGGIETIFLKINHQTLFCIQISILAAIEGLFNQKLSRDF